MLGRVSEAEDLVQEIWLSWRQQDPAAIQSAKAWLVAATTRRCIDQLRSARRQREEYYGVWLPEPLMAAPEPSPAAAAETADSLTMAFMLMLESLGPTERAVFLLREVFDYDYADVAAITGKGQANCRQIVSRARSQLRANPPPATPPTARARQLVEEFLAAAASGEVTDILALLTDDSTVLSDGGGQVKAAGRPILGADKVSRFLLGTWPRFGADMVRRAVDINGHPGLLLSHGGQVHYAFAFELAGERVRHIYIICNPDKLRHLAVQR